MKKIFFLLLFLNFLLYKVDAQKNLQNGLIAYYAFNGNANNSISKIYNGIIHGAVLTNDRFGNKNSAYSFNGINQFIRVNNLGKIIPSNDISISIWIKSLSSQSQFQLMLCPDSNRFAIAVNYFHDNKNTDFFDFGWTGDGGDADGRLYVYQTQNTQWHHYVFVSSTEKHSMKIYKDGEIIASKDQSLPLINASQKYLNIGCGNNSSFFNGVLDEIRIYNREISFKEVSALFNETNSSKKNKFKHYK